MFIYALIVGKRQEHNKPTGSLDDPDNYRDLSNGHIIPLQHPVLFLSRRKNMVTEQPVQRP
jgi:hypothetical protein